VKGTVIHTYTYIYTFANSGMFFQFHPSSHCCWYSNWGRWRRGGVGEGNKVGGKEVTGKE